MILSGKRVFSETFRILKERFGPLLGILATFFVLQIVMSMVVAALFGSAIVAAMTTGSSQIGGFSNFGAGMIGGIILFYFVYLLVAIAQFGALSSMSSPLRQTTFGAALVDGLRCAPTFIGVTLLGLVGYLLFALVLGIVFAALAAGAGGAGAAIGVIFTLVAIIYIFSRLITIMPTIAVEKIRNPITALIQAWNMTKGNVFKIVLVNVVFLIGLFVLFGASLVPIFGALKRAGMGGTTPDFGTMGVSLLLFFVVGIVMMLFGCAFQAVIHAELSDYTKDDVLQTFE